MPTLVREIWPVIVRQMNYFLDTAHPPRPRAGARVGGLGEPNWLCDLRGSGLERFHLQGAGGRRLSRQRHRRKAAGGEIRVGRRKIWPQPSTQVLWNEKEGTYYSGYTEDYEKAKGGRKVNVPIEGNLIAPTMFPALFALDQGIVPAARRAAGRALPARPSPAGRAGS